MNAKIVATLAVAVMVFAGVAVIMSMDDVSAADGDTYHKELIQTDQSSAEWELVVTQAEFIGSKHVLTWYSTEDVSTDSANVYNIDNDATWTAIGKSTCDAKGDTSFIALTTSDVTVAEKTGAVGAYTFTIPVPADGQVKACGLKCEITMETSTGVSQTYSIFYTVPVQKVDSTTKIATFTFGTQAQGTVGQEYREAVTVSGAKNADGYDISGFTMQSRDNYFWYAQGLPDGLAMSENGYISGIPLTATATEGKIVTVTATEKETGNVITGDLTVVINPRDSSTENTFLNKYKYTVTVGTGESAPVYTNPISIIVETDLASNVVLKTYTKATGSGSDTLTNMAVQVIGEDGKKYSVDSGNTGEYRLPISGTGAYKVVMTAPDNVQTEQFYLFVTAQLGEVAPGIIPTGN